MSWNASEFQNGLNLINENCAAQGLIRMRVYGDKIFNSDFNLVAAYSIRHGPLQIWYYVTY